MKHLKKLALFSAILLTLLMGSCDALFSNKFQEFGLGQVDAAALQDADSDTLIEQSGIDSGTISQSFIDAALADDETKAAVVAELTAAAADPDPEVAQTAQVLLIEIKLQDSGASQVMDNIGDAITEIMNQQNEGGDFDPGDADDLDSLVSSLIPAEMMEDDEALAAMFDSLADVGANEIDDFGANLAANDLQNENIDVGTMAQTAVVAAVVSTLAPAPGAPAGTTIGDAIVAAMNNTDDTKDFDDFVTIPDTDSDGKSDLEELKDDPNLAAILTAGDLGWLLDAMSGAD